MQTVWVDGDSCFREIRDWLIKEAEESLWKLKIIVDSDHIPSIYDNTLWVVIQSGKDKVDRYIRDNLNENHGDIVVTRDLLFAQSLVGKGVTVLNDRGLQFSMEYLKIRLEEREISLALKAGGSRSAKLRVGFKPMYLKDFKEQIKKLTKE